MTTRQPVRPQVDKTFVQEYEKTKRIQKYWSEQRIKDESRRRWDLAATERYTTNLVKQDAFFYRLIGALRNDSIPAVAKALGVSLRPTRRAMTKIRANTKIYNGEDLEFWKALMEALDETIGGLMGMREEIQRKLAEEFREAMAERQRTQDR